MRSLVIAVVCTLAVLFSCVQAQAGMAVTDATSYAYYAQQINQMTENINQLKAQTTGQFQRLEDLKAQLTGQFTALKSVYSQLGNIKNVFDMKPTSLLEEAKKWTQLKDLVSGYTGIDGAIADTFKDPRSTDININKIAFMNRQYSMKQSALKNSISHADALLQTVPDRMKAIDALQAAAGQAQSMSEKQDVTNALLVEMLRTLTTYSSVLLEFNQSAALMNFTGADSAVTKTREQQIWATKKKIDAAVDTKALRQKMQGLGVDAGMSSQHKF